MSWLSLLGRAADGEKGVNTDMLTLATICDHVTSFFSCPLFSRADFSKMLNQNQQAQFVSLIY